MPVIELLYAICVTLLGAYGLNSLLLTWMYLRRRDHVPPLPPPPAEWPHVTVQLPIYNEMHMVERLLSAVAALEYPRDKLHIQVLDDSTDATRQVVANVVTRLQQQGLDIVHVTRAQRTGFKAGALSFGLTQTDSELIAIFDADFLPPPDFLRRTVPYFADAHVGCVQARWGHVNREYSILTELQALGIDGHFVVEQCARNLGGYFINFNGTAGIWRRACIDDAGGWQGDTLTEDLDLSYRAQLRGWRMVYVPGVIVPAELPAQISALKRQQARWAQGSIQTAIKLFGPLLSSNQPWRVKMEGILHLTGYLVHPLMLAVILLTFPMSFSRSWVVMGAPWLMIAAVGPPLMYTVAQISDGGNWGYRLRLLPMLVMLGTGMCLNNTIAVVRALLGVRTSFQRTPKFDLRRAGDNWMGSIYALRRDALVWGELLLALLAMGAIFLPSIRWTFIPWLLLYAGGFGYIGGLSLYQTYQLQRWATLVSHGAAEAKVAR
ncbi:MAG: cellulose synthase family protein [Anaerolineae bacterium]